MEKTTLKELVNSGDAQLIFGNPNDIIKSISTDTRTLRKSDYFFALPGENYDGHQFLRDAIIRGANGLILSNFKGLDGLYLKFPNIIFTNDTLKLLGDFAKFYREKKISPIVIGISGSNGKTTTKEMLFSILKKVSPTTASEKSYNNLIGLPLSIFKTNSSHTYCILEHGISRPNEMDRLLEISKPKVGIVTNIGETHLEFLSTKEKVFEEETKLLFSLPEDGIAVINSDDEFLSRLINKFKNSITFGLNESADVTAKNITFYSSKTKFELRIRTREKNVLSTIVVMPAVGNFNVLNALASASAAYMLGVDITTIKAGLEEFQLPPMRMQQVYLPTGTVVVNDAYNANPNSMRVSIDTFMEVYREYSKIVVIGDMLELGEKAIESHKTLGKYLSTLNLQKIFLTGELTKYTYETILMNGKVDVKYIPNREQLIYKLRECLDENTAIFFKASRKIQLEKIIENLQ